MRHFALVTSLVISAAAGLGPAVQAASAPVRGGHGPVAVHRRPHVFFHGYYGYRGWYGPYYGPAYYGPYAYPYPPEPPNYAIIDTDISPEEAKVYLDGERLGEADDFDGLPKYLLISPGRHVLEFRRSGYQTLRIDIDARRGHYYDIDRSLNEGRSGDKPHEENWGAPPRTRHEMRSPPPRSRRGDEDRDDDRSLAPDRNDDPDDQANPDDQDGPDDEYGPDVDENSPEPDEPDK